MMRYILAAIIALTFSAPGFAWGKYTPEEAAEIVMIKGRLILVDDKKGVYAFDYGGLLFWCRADNKAFQCCSFP